jgi:hypothetical protein
MHRLAWFAILVISASGLCSERLYAQHEWLDSEQQALLSCIDSVRSRRPATPADTTWTTVAWPPANLVFYRPEVGCTVTTEQALAWVGRDANVDVRFVPTRPAVSASAHLTKHCMDCTHAESELADTLHGVRIEHRRGGITAMDALFTTRTMPCTDSLVLRVEAITSIHEADLGLRLVNSARITGGGPCAVSGPLDTLDAGG